VIVRLFLSLAAFVSVLFSLNAHALDRVVRFKIRKLAPHIYDASYVWNPFTKEATIRMGLEAVDNSVLIDRPLSLSSARDVKLIIVDGLEYMEGCELVTRWQMNLEPNLPDYLMYVTLQGSHCQRVAQNIEIFQTRWRFLGLSDTAFIPQDVSVEISR
jgi:hypothetical protein